MYTVWSPAGGCRRDGAGRRGRYVGDDERYGADHRREGRRDAELRLTAAVDLYVHREGRRRQGVLQPRRRHHERVYRHDHGQRRHPRRDLHRQLRHADCRDGGVWRLARPDLRQRRAQRSANDVQSPGETRHGRHGRGGLPRRRVLQLGWRQARPHVHRFRDDGRYDGWRFGPLGHGRQCQRPVRHARLHAHQHGVSAAPGQFQDGQSRPHQHRRW